MVAQRGDAIGAAVDQGIGAALVVSVHPAHHGLGAPAEVRGHLRGTSPLGNIVEGEHALAGAGMRCTQGQGPQVLRGLSPARRVNA